MSKWVFKFADQPFSEEELMLGTDAIQRGDQKRYKPNLPRCPQALVMVDIQQEFNKNIGFNTREFLVYLKMCERHGTEFHVVWDQVGERPTIFDNLSNIRFYEKAYAADPYEGVIDKETGEKLDTRDMDMDTIYYDPAARLDVFYVGGGHEYQHVWPDMRRLAENLRGKDVILIGGACYECLEDISKWLEISDIRFQTEMRFIY